VKGSARGADAVHAAPVPVRKPEAAKPPTPDPSGVVSFGDDFLTTA